MGRKFRGQVAETQAVKTLREKMRQALADQAGYFTGALEQLMVQQGQMMSVQAGIVEYLDELSTKRRDDVGAEVRITSIVEYNIAKGRAARAEREQAKVAEVAKAAEAVNGGPLSVDSKFFPGQAVVTAGSPADIAPPVSPADAAPDATGSA